MLKIGQMEAYSLSELIALNRGHWFMARSVHGVREIIPRHKYL